MTKLKKANLGLLIITSYLLYCVLIEGALGLYRFEEWHSVKSFYQNGLMSAQPFLRERQTLAENQLNLSEWNGYHEVFWDNQLNWNTLEFKLKMEKDAYLWIFLSRSPAKKIAIRLSQNSKFKSGLYILDQNDFILNRYPFLFDFKESEQGQIKIETQNQQIRIYLNEQLQFSLPVILEKDQLLSFRVGKAKVSIDDVSVKNEGKEKFENFTSPFQWKYFLFSLVCSLVIWYLLSVIFRKKNHADFKICSGQVSAIFLLISYFFLDHYIWSKSYYINAEQNFKLQNFYDIQDSAEKNRKIFFHSLASLLNDTPAEFNTQKVNLVSNFQVPINRKNLSETAKAYFKSNGMDQNLEQSHYQLIDRDGHVQFVEDFLELPIKKKNEVRILFLGTSQTWGGGARSLDESYPSLLIKRLNQRIKTKLFQGFNLAIQGSDSKEQLDQFQFFSKLWPADIVIIDLGNNDFQLEVFRKNLDEIVSELKLENRDVFLLKEANSFEYDDRALLKRHQIIEDVATKYQMTSLDLHHFIQKKSIEDVGLVWWDIVHFSATGHVLTADWLSDQLLLKLKD